MIDEVGECKRKKQKKTKFFFIVLKEKSYCQHDEVFFFIHKHTSPELIKKKKINYKMSIY
jgi:hypothetical protein